MLRLLLLLSLLEKETRYFINLSASFLVARPKYAFILVIIVVVVVVVVHEILS